MLRLIKFNFETPRSGCLTGLFILNENDWPALNKLIQNKVVVYFGEVLGKHSEISGPIAPHEIEVVTEDQEFCRKFQDLLGATVGYNPLDYLEEEDEEEGVEEDV